MERTGVRYNLTPHAPNNDKTNGVIVRQWFDTACPELVEGLTMTAGKLTPSFLTLQQKWRDHDSR